MIKKRYIFIASALSMCLVLGVAYAEADTSICYNCGGKGYTSITIMRTQVIGYNSITGMPTTIQIPDE